MKDTKENLFLKRLNEMGAAGSRATRQFAACMRLHGLSPDSEEEGFTVLGKPTLANAIQHLSI